MGKGGALLGKAVKGKSKEDKKKGDKKSQLEDSIVSKQMTDGYKMLEEYEKMNKLAEAQRQRLKKLEQQETFNTKINHKILVNIHRKFMRAEKVSSLRKEVEILAQNHERDVDRKDAIIQMLLKDMDDAEEQFQVAQRTHMSKVQGFVSLHQSKLRQLETEFERELKALKQEFNTESERIITQHSREVKEMRGIIQAVESEESERLAEAKQNHETEREEIRNKHLEAINELRINLENKIDELERQFNEAHRTYVEGTNKDNKRFKELQRDDKKLSKRISQQRRMIERCQANLSYWKIKLESNHKECTERNSALAEQRDAIVKHCNALKSRMARFRQTEAKRLSELTLMARECLQDVSKKAELAERNLQLAEQSRKLETEREKVVPFYETSVRTGEGKGSDMFAAEADSQTQQLFEATKRSLGDSQPADQWSQLDNFFKKYNKVLLDKLAIEQEKERLQKENGDLRSILKQYLDGVAVTADVVDYDNPLLIVNGRVNLLKSDGAVRRLQRPGLVQEGNTVVQNYAVQLSRS